MIYFLQHHFYHEKDSPSHEDDNEASYNLLENNHDALLPEEEIRTEFV